MIFKISPYQHSTGSGTEDGRSTSVFVLYRQLSQGLMADFPAQMKPSYTSNEMTQFAAHLKMCFVVNQIDDLQSSNKKQSWTGFRGSG